MDQDYKGFVQKAPDQIIKHLPSDACWAMNSEEAIITLEVFFTPNGLSSTIQRKANLQLNFLSNANNQLCYSVKCTKEQNSTCYHVWVYNPFTQGCSDLICQIAISIHTELIKWIEYLP